MLWTTPKSLRHFLMPSSKCFIVSAFTFWSIIHFLSPLLPNFVRCVNSIIPEHITFAYYFPTHVSEFTLVLFLTTVVFTASSFANISLVISWLVKPVPRQFPDQHAEVQYSLNLGPNTWGAIGINITSLVHTFLLCVMF